MPWCASEYVGKILKSFCTKLLHLYKGVKMSLGESVESATIAQSYENTFDASDANISLQ